jgi:hypothetical protein
MIVLSNSNIDIIQGVIGYGNAQEGITDWRISNSNNGTFNIFNSSSELSRFTIIDNGNIGVGITPTSTSSLLEISGDINISGIYKQNNIDVMQSSSNYINSTSNILVNRIVDEVRFGSNYTSNINATLNTRVNDTSNYVLSTSNILVNRNNSQWTSISSGIYYNTNNIITTAIINSSPQLPLNATGIIGTDRYMIFTYTTNSSGLTEQTRYEFTTTEILKADILIIGGGGEGSAGGGGGGGYLYYNNIDIPIGNYTVIVGNGGMSEQSTQNGNQGASSLFIGNSFSYTAFGGGGGGNYLNIAPAHTVGQIGSYGGNGHDAQTVQTYTSTQGNRGGNALVSNYGSGGGGGGANQVGGNAVLVPDQNPPIYLGGKGGNGIANDITGSLIYYAGGGTAGINHVGQVTVIPTQIDPLGGGGKGSVTNRGNGENGKPNTGGGGGGGDFDREKNASGGSGVVIFRYRNNTKVYTNVGIGTTNPISDFHVYDNITNNTTLTIENNYKKEPIIITPNTGYSASETIENNINYRILRFSYFMNYPDNPPNTSLLAWYKFDGDGFDYNPYTTKYHLIAYVGTPRYSSGTTADSFFQGRRYINTGTGSLQTTLSLNSRAFSVAVWVRTKTTGGGQIIAQNTGFTTNQALILYCGGNNTYNLAYYGNDLNSAIAYSADVNVWVHLVFVVFSNNNRRVYRNGFLISTDTNGSAFIGTGNLKIGASYTDNASQNIDISDLRIYNNGLLPSEVATLYDSYTNLEITDNYDINFANTTEISVNEAPKTVNGLYKISIGHINSSMLPLGGQPIVPLTLTTTRTVTIKYPYDIYLPTLPTLITAENAISTIIGTTDRCISFSYINNSFNLTGQTLYTFTPTQNLICDILIVGGGGGGGYFGGGGGGGGVLLGTNFKLNAGSTVSIKVGKGGAGNASQNGGVNGENGFDSSITVNSIEYIAKGGGGGGSRNSASNGVVGNAGGSGGGGSHSNGAQVIGGASNKNNYTNFQSFGNNGGKGRNGTVGAEPTHSSGGGGGAGSAGSDASNTIGGGNGGTGKDFIKYFGKYVGHNGYFAGGGGGNTYFGAGNRGYGNGGLGLYGGGGDAGYDGTFEYSGEEGMSNTGGGGGGGRWDGTSGGNLRGGNGGTGFVIIRYRINSIQTTTSIELIRTTEQPNEILVANTTSTTIGLYDRLISFSYTSTSSGLTLQTGYILTITENLICDILIVGGGGGGSAGGGGGGGYLYYTNVYLSSGNYEVRVGDGGTGATSTTNGNQGANSSFIGGSISYTAYGGGGGGGNSQMAPSHTTGQVGSYGGNGHDNTNGQTTTAYVSIQGNLGGVALFTSSASGGGGGGAGSIGGDAVLVLGISSQTATTRYYKGGKGGDGKINNITNTLTYYAGGGTAGANTNTGTDPTVQTSPLGGGGIGSLAPNANGANGTNGLGGGGGGGDWERTAGSKGGSGIVIIRYRKGESRYSIGNYNGDFKIISTSITSNITDYMRITADGASIYNPTGSPMWSTISDKRIKENIEVASYDKCYDNINKLELYRFNYIKELNNINKDYKQLGYIAQEVENIFPKAISTQIFYNNTLSISDLLSIDISQINYSLYGAVKKLIEMYNDIEKKVDVLEKILNIDNTSNINELSLNINELSSNINELSLNTSNINELSSNINELSLDTSNINELSSNINELSSNINDITSNTSNINDITLNTSNINELSLNTSNINELSSNINDITLDTSNINDITLNTSNTSNSSKLTNQ